MSPLEARSAIGFTPCRRVSPPFDPTHDARPGRTAHHPSRVIPREAADRAMVGAVL
jgi:hypothetical protein